MSTLSRRRICLRRYLRLIARKVGDSKKKRRIVFYAAHVESIGMVDCGEKAGEVIISTSTLIIRDLVKMIDCNYVRFILNESYKINPFQF